MHPPGNNIRIGWEEDLFGDAYHDATPFERCKYGALNVTGLLMERFFFVTPGKGTKDAMETPIGHGSESAGTLS